MQQKLSWPHRVICLRPVGTYRAGFLRRPAFSKLSWLERAPCPDLGGERGTFNPSARWRTRLREGRERQGSPSDSRASSACAQAKTSQATESLGSPRPATAIVVGEVTLEPKRPSLHMRGCEPREMPRATARHLGGPSATLMRHCFPSCMGYLEPNATPHWLPHGTVLHPSAQGCRLLQPLP